MSASTGDSRPLHVTSDGDTSNAVIAYSGRLLAETREEIGRADQKASILLSAAGVGVALLVGQLTGHWSPTHLAPTIQWLWWLGSLPWSRRSCASRPP